MLLILGWVPLQLRTWESGQVVAASRVCLWEGVGQTLHSKRKTSKGRKGSQAPRKSESQWKNSCDLMAVFPACRPGLYPTPLCAEPASHVGSRSLALSAGCCKILWNLVHSHTPPSWTVISVLALLGYRSALASEHRSLVPSGLCLECTESSSVQAGSAGSPAWFRLACCREAALRASSVCHTGLCHCLAGLHVLQFDTSPAWLSWPCSCQQSLQGSPGLYKLWLACSQPLPSPSYVDSHTPGIC